MFKKWSFKNKLLPECSVYYLVSLRVDLNNVCFVAHPTERLGKEFICRSAIDIHAVVMGYSLCLILGLFFYNSLSTYMLYGYHSNESVFWWSAIKNCFQFRLVSIDWTTVFMQLMMSVHRRGLPHGLFYYSAHLAGILSKRFVSFDTVCFGHWSGAICRYF